MVATGTSEFIDSTTADAFIGEIWSRYAIEAREQRLVFADLVDRRYESELTFGDTIHVPSVSALAAQTKVKAANTALSYQTNTEANTDITVATWEYVGLAEETIVKKQANRDQLKMYAGKMGYALDEAVDDVLAGLIDDFSVTPVGTLAQSLPYDDVLQAIQQLDDANAPEEDRVWVVSPKQVAEWMKLDYFMKADYSALHGAKGAPAGKHYSRSWLDDPVYKSTNVEGSNAAGHDNGYFHKSALALVMQQVPKTYHQFDIDFLVDKVVMEQLYGVREMRDDHGVFCRGL